MKIRSSCFKLAAVAGLLLLVPTVRALEWDTNLVTPGAQGAISPQPWLGTNFWWNGSANQAWVSSADAIFGGIPGTVIIATGQNAIADDLLFPGPGYLIDGPGNFSSALTLSGGDATNTITTLGNQFGNTTIDVPLRAPNGFDKAGPAALTMGSNEGTIAVSGTINVLGGFLDATLGITQTATPDPLVINFANVGGARFRHGGNGPLTLTALTGGGTTGGEFQMNGQLTIDASNPHTFTGILSGGMRLRKTGPATFTLTNISNSFTGIVTVNEGVLDVSTIGALGTGALQLENGGTLRFSSATNQTSFRAISLLGTGGGVVDIFNPGVVLTVTGVVSEAGGARALTKSGVGQLALSSNANSFTGGIRIENGALSVSDVMDSGANSPLGRSGTIALGGLGVTEGTLIFTGSANDATNRPFQLTSGGGIEVANAGTTLTLSGEISNNDALLSVPVFRKLGPGILVLAGINTYDDADITGLSPASQTFVTAGTLRMGTNDALPNRTRVTVAGGAILDLNLRSDAIGSLEGSGSVINLTNFTVGRDNSSAIFSGAISGDGIFVKSGTGILTLSGTSTWTGGIIVTDGGAVSVPSVTNDGTDGPLGGTGVITLGDSATGGTLIFAGASGSTNRPISLGAGSGTFEVDDPFGTLTLTGLITGTGGVLTKAGRGTLLLANGANSFAGGVVISRGAVRVTTLANAGTNSPLGQNGTITLGDATGAGRLIVTATNFPATNRAFFLANGGGEIEVTEPAGTLQLRGPIDGAGPLRKLGPGDLLMDGDKAYTGATTVESGTITLLGSLAGSAVTVVGGGRLASDTTNRSVGALTLAGGTLFPGRTIDPARVTAGNTRLMSGTLGLDFASATAGVGHDQLNVIGSLMLEDTITLTLRLAFDPADFSDVLRIISNDGNDPTTLTEPNGRFSFNGNILEEGEVFSVTGGPVTQLFEMRYGLTAGDNDVRLVALPEPGSLLFFTLGFALVAARRGDSRVPCRGVGQAEFPTSFAA